MLYLDERGRQGSGGVSLHAEDAGCLSPLNADVLFVFIWGNEQAGQGDN